MTVRFGEFVLDSDARRLMHDGQEVRLSPKAFDLLCTLVAERPRVVSKSDLIRRIWPDTFVVEANLNVLVAEIRRALGDAPRSPRFVRTAHGVGYAFSGDAMEADSAAPAGSKGPHCWVSWRDRRFTLSPGDNIIGRDPHSAVWVEDASVSRRHARIRVDSDLSTAYLDDLESTNGTFIGGTRAQAGTRLQDGDAIRVGSVQLKFHVWSDTGSRTRRIRGRGGSPR